MKRPLLPVLAGCMLGEAAAMVFGIWGFAIIALLPVSFFLLVRLQKGYFRLKDYRSILILLVIAMLFGQSIYYAAFCRFRSDAIGNGGISEKSINVSLCGKVREVKKTSTGSIQLLLDEVSYRDVRKKGEEKRSKSGCKVIIREGEIFPDDRIRVKGKLSDIMPATNPGEYDASLYYRAKGVSLEMYADSCDVLNRPSFSLHAWAYRISMRIVRVFDKEFGKEEAALLKAMVLADRSDLSEEIKRPYEENGVAHLLAVSGLHISIVGGQIFKRLRKRKCSYLTASLAGMAVLLFYGIMTGFGSSVTRAVIMYMIYMISQLYGQSYDIVSSMCLSGVLMLTEYPYRILESGFQISFTCVFVIGLVLPVVKDLITRYTENRFILKLTQSFAIGIYTSPMIMQVFSEINPFSPLLNLIVIPAMTPLMISGILTGLCGLLWFDIGGLPVIAVLAYVIKLPAVAILRFYHILLSISSNLHGSSIVTGSPGVLRTIITYCFLTGILYVLSKEITRKFYILGMMSVIYTISWYSVGFHGLRITMLDVGQGDCILLQSNGTNVLIDGGSSTEKQSGKYILEPALKYYGITKLEHVLVSHEDEDHISAILELIDDHYPIERMYFSKAGGTEGNLYQKWESDHLYGKNQIACQRGQGFHMADMDFLCLHPGAFSGNEINNNSQVFLMKYGEFTALFTGDIEETGEVELLDHIGTNGRSIRKLIGETGIDVLKVAHHGSSGSSCQALLRTFHPSTAIISAGRSNSYGHPAKETLERLSSIADRIYCTRYQGAIVIEASRKGTYSVSCPFGQCR